MTEKEEVLEIYKVMVDTIIANEQRRQQISSVFITLIVAGFGAAGAIADFSLINATAPAALISIIWWLQVKYLKNLAEAKFHVIAELEAKLTYRPFEAEWDYLLGGKQQALKNNLRIGLSQIEMTVPILIFFASITHIVMVICEFSKT